MSLLTSLDILPVVTLSVFIAILIVACSLLLGLPRARFDKNSCKSPSAQTSNHSVVEKESFKFSGITSSIYKKMQVSDGIGPSNHGAQRGSPNLLRQIEDKIYNKKKELELIEREKSTRIHDWSRKNDIQMKILRIKVELGNLEVSKFEIIKKEAEETAKRKEDEYIINEFNRAYESLKKSISDATDRIKVLMTQLDFTFQLEEKEKLSIDCTKLFNFIERLKKSREILLQKLIETMDKLNTKQKSEYVKLALREIFTETTDLEIYILNFEFSLRELQERLDSDIVRSFIDDVFDCPICLDKHSVEDVFVMSLCNHKLCRHSATELVKNDLRTGNIPLTCPVCKMEPCANCPQSRGQGDLTTEEEKFCKISDNDLEKILEGTELTNYYRAMMDNLVRSDGSCFVRCLSENCGQINFKDPDEYRCTCIYCGYLWCSNCNVEWHEGSTCEQYQQWKRDNEEGDAEFEKMKEEGTVKVCPHCKNWGVKEHYSQCNAITCRNCKGRFCWLCQKSLNHLSNPHSHFSEAGDCYSKCFYGVER